MKSYDYIQALINSVACKFELPAASLHHPESGHTCNLFFMFTELNQAGTLVPIARLRWEKKFTPTSGGSGCWASYWPDSTDITDRYTRTVGDLNQSLDELIYSKEKEGFAVKKKIEITQELVIDAFRAVRSD